MDPTTSNSECEPQQSQIKLWGSECTPEWARLPTEPLGPEMMDELKAELQRNWRYHDKYCAFPKTMKYFWSDLSWVVHLGDRVTKLTPRELRQLCNKPTCFYWTRNAQLNDDIGRRTFIIAAILKEWYRCYNGDPGIENNFFFANPLVITSDGPTTVTGILDTHKTYCEQASSLLDKIIRGDMDWRFWPPASCYKMLPLFRAIIVLYDEPLDDDSLRTIRHDGILNLDEFLEAQSVSIVRTGDERGLSGPISFDGLEGGTPDKIDVRVSLGAAVRFIANLERREEAFSERKAMKLTPDEDRRETRESYAASLLCRAAESGIDNVIETAYAIRRIKARQRGESFDEPEPYRLGRYMK